MTYWCAYGVEDGTLHYVAAIFDGLALIGQHEAALRFASGGIPAESVIVLDLHRHINATRFGAGTLPQRPGMMLW